jgi:hypothetical protein
LRGLTPLATVLIGGCWFLLSAIFYRRFVLNSLMKQAIADANAHLEEAKASNADPATIKELEAMLNRLLLDRMTRIIEHADIDIY